VVIPSRLVVAAVALAAAGALRAQQAGSLRGNVFDKDFDAPLAGATVQIVENGLKAETNDQGAFVFQQLPPGRYTVMASKDGYVRAVRSEVQVQPGQLTELRFDLAGDYTDLEEFVVKDNLQLDTGNEAALLDLRLDSPALVDSISADLMSKAGAGDAAGALRLVSGASTANGKSAVIRGLPDRYVSSQLNGVLLPSADEDKRAVELDQFPSEVIESLQVSKTFTPDQQGNASGGAVNVVLKGVPDEPFFVKYKAGTSYNSQFTGRSDFLSYRGGGVHAFGKSGRERGEQPLGGNWDGAVGATLVEAPRDFKGALSLGGGHDIGGGWRVGGFANFNYERDSFYVGDARDDSLLAFRAGDPLSPQFNQGTPQSGEFYTQLLDIKQSKQSASWGGLATAGIANDDHAINFTYLRTQTAEDGVTFAEDTRGKEYFFPGHDPTTPGTPGWEQPLGAPYLRLQTLAYVERTTETQQLNGRHRLEVLGVGSLRRAEIDWAVSRSEALRDEPDRRQFATAWNPNGVYLQYKPAAQFTLGNLQRIYKRITETSEEEALSVKLPFDVGGARKGYLKFGGFRDRVQRSYDQETFSNFNDPNFFQPGDWFGLDWTALWEFQDHPISASEVDVDYDGRQAITAGFGMIEYPLADWVKFIGGVRVESTDIRIVNTPESEALWVPPGQFGTAVLLPGDGDVDFRQQDTLPSASLVFDPLPGVTVRTAYNQTVARQTFKELTPIFQQEFLGGPVFVGDPSLEMSAVENYDLRVDWIPEEGTLLSASWFRKDIDKPIEYIEKLAQYNFTTAVNYPSGRLEGVELEARQQLGRFWRPLDGLGVGANATWIDASVRRPESELDEFEALQGFRPRSTRDMTNAPEFLYNAFVTWDIEATKTSFGFFYTVTGDSLIQGPGPSNSFFVPATYETRYEQASVTLSQQLAKGVRLALAGRNLTNALRREVYRSEYIDDDVTRRSYTEGVEWSLSIGGEIRF
jgi:outer membrane receptor protein involved in Fe transport